MLNEFEKNVRLSMISIYYFGYYSMVRYQAKEEHRLNAWRYSFVK